MSADPGIVSVLWLRVLPGKEEEVVRFYEQERIFERSRESGGFRSGRLLEPLVPGAPFVVIAEWDDAAAYQGWLDNPVRAELGEQLIPLLDGEPAPGSLYRPTGPGQ